MGKPTLKQIFDAQISQVLVGKTYLSIAKGLLDADPVILQDAWTFFAITIDGHVELAQMAIARLYDRTQRGVTIRVMLSESRKQASSFQRADQQQVIAAIKKAEIAVLGLDPILASIRKRRNERLAHLNPRTVVDPKTLSTEAKLTIPDIEKAIATTEQILAEMTHLFEGTIGDIRFFGSDDYKVALNWIRRAKCDFIENYEKEFGAWTGPRPKDCSRKPYDLL